MGILNQYVASVKHDREVQKAAMKFNEILQNERKEAEKLATQAQELAAQEKERADQAQERADRAESRLKELEKELAELRSEKRL